jgi:hypothetical protein
MPVTKSGLAKVFFAAAALAAFTAGSSLPASAADADETELLKYFKTVDVWHFHVDYMVGYNNQDVVVTRELSPKEPVDGKLCYIRFDLLSADGDYAYGLKPASAPGPRKNTEWGVYVHKRGSVLNQLRSSLKLDAIYFYVGEPRDEFKDAAAGICERKQDAKTPEAGQAYGNNEWSTLVVRGKLTHGWPQKRTP